MTAATRQHHQTVRPSVRFVIIAWYFFLCVRRVAESDSCFRHVCPSVSKQQLGSHSLVLRGILFCRLCRHLKFGKNRTKVSGTLHGGFRIFRAICLLIHPEMRNTSKRFYSKWKHKFHVKYIPPPSRSQNTAKPDKLHTMGFNMAQRSYDLHGR